MIEHGRAVARQMFSEPDGAPLGPAEQSGENILLERCVRAGVLAGAGIPARLSRWSKGCPNPPLMPPLADRARLKERDENVRL